MQSFFKYLFGIIVFFALLGILFQVNFTNFKATSNSAILQRWFTSDPYFKEGTNTTNVQAPEEDDAPHPPLKEDEVPDPEDIPPEEEEEDDEKAEAPTPSPRPSPSPSPEPTKSPVKPLVWPEPLEMTFGAESLSFSASAVAVDIVKSANEDPPSAFLLEIVKDLERKLHTTEKQSKAEKSCTQSKKKLNRLRVMLNGEDEQDGVYTYPSGSNEEYTLDVKSDGTATIQAASVHGIVRGLQTFYQIVFNGKCFVVEGVPIHIHDKPTYSYRGLLIDPARNFWPLESIYKVLEVLAASKMNALHLHLTDDQGFSVEIKRYPNLAVPSDVFVEFQQELAKPTTPKKFYYTQEDIKQLIKDALKMGVRIIPELGMPGHTGAWYTEGIITKCPGFACNRAWSLTMNPMLDKTYEVIKGVLEEVVVLFPDPLMHLGGDEVWEDCWREDSTANGNDRVHKFEDKLWEIIQALPVKKDVIRWEETYKWLHRKEPYTYQFWLTHEHEYFDNLPRNAIQSTGWYYNHNGGPIGCQNWKECYWKLFPGAKSVLGGEGCAWEMRDFHFFSEQVPLRVIGTGERLWGTAAALDKKTTMEESITERMKRICTIIASQSVVPQEWCSLDGPSQNDVSKHMYDFAVNEVERDSMICHRINPQGSCTTKNCVISGWISSYRDKINGFYDTFSSSKVCNIYREPQTTRMEIESCPSGYGEIKMEPSPQKN